MIEKTFNINTLKYMYIYLQKKIKKKRINK